MANIGEKLPADVINDDISATYYLHFYKSFVITKRCQE